MPCHRVELLHVTESDLDTHSEIENAEVGVVCLRIGFKTKLGDWLTDWLSERRVDMGKTSSMIFAMEVELTDWLTHLTWPERGREGGVGWLVVVNDRVIFVFITYSCKLLWANSCDFDQIMLSMQLVCARMRRWLCCVSGCGVSSSKFVFERGRMVKDAGVAQSHCGAMKRLGIRLTTNRTQNMGGPHPLYI